MTVTWAPLGHAHSAVPVFLLSDRLSRYFFRCEVNMYFLNYWFGNTFFVFCYNLCLAFHHLHVTAHLKRPLLCQFLLLPALPLNFRLLLFICNSRGLKCYISDAQSLSCFSCQLLEFDANCFSSLFAMPQCQTCTLSCFLSFHLLFPLLFTVCLTEEEKANHRRPAGWQKTGDAEKAPAVPLLRPQV